MAVQKDCADLIVVVQSYGSCGSFADSVINGEDNLKDQKLGRRVEEVAIHTVDARSRFRPHTRHFSCAVILRTLRMALSRL
jgi:hypothetical protein